MRDQQYRPRLHSKVHFYTRVRCPSDKMRPIFVRILHCLHRLHLGLSVCSLDLLSLFLDPLFQAAPGVHFQVDTHWPKLSGKVIWTPSWIAFWIDRGHSSSLDRWFAEVGEEDLLLWANSWNPGLNKIKRWQFLNDQNMVHDFRF